MCKSASNPTHFRYLYGPVYSWRLGVSLGIDPIATKRKVCNFDCVYCQLGRTKVLSNRRSEFVPTRDLIREIKKIPLSLKIDYLTFSGRGEPTLARNLGAMIKGIKRVRPEKIAVLTNATLLLREDVRRDLMLADFVLLKLDGVSPKTLQAVDHPVPTIHYNDIIKGMMKFCEDFSGKLALQIMLVNKNKRYARRMSQIARLINPDEIQLNTPLRPCGVHPLSREEINEAKGYFEGMNVISVYDIAKKELEPFNFKETVKRHGNFLRSRVKGATQKEKMARRLPEGNRRQTA